MHVDDDRTALFGSRREVPGAERQVRIVASRDADIFIIGATVIFWLVHLLFMRRMDQRVRGGVGNVGHCSSENEQDNEEEDGYVLQCVFLTVIFFFASRANLP